MQNNLKKLYMAGIHTSMLKQKSQCVKITTLSPKKQPHI